MKQTFIYNGVGWWLKISTIEEMCAYLNIEWKRRKEDVLADKKRVEKKFHSSNYLTSSVDILSSVCGESFESVLDDFQKELYNVWYKALLDGNTIFVNSLGGYCFSQPIKKVYRKDGFDFPVFHESDIRIKKWQGGHHYYAYIGDMQITDGDVVKWNTEEEARKMARKYISKAL